ncbi:MAG: hypothetical protein JW850_12345 [Thermoflexales bacterium]|nr:hypothetical protein [Thermoflexales bacterium]
MDPSRVPDYLVIGHVCRDVILSPGGEPQPSFGGTVTYAARTVRALGLKVAVVTSAAPDVSLTPILPGIAVHCVPSASTTTFENRYDGSQRSQILRATAAPISLDDVPALWRQASLVHLGPVAQEVDPALVTAFPAALVGVTPQGWLRAWDETGRVYPHSQTEERLRGLLAGDGRPGPDAVVLSIEDVGGDEEVVARLAACARRCLLVVTRGELGATLYVRGKAEHIPAPRVRAVDPTGAGDIFAAAFFAGLLKTRDPHRAARLAVCLASASVRRPGLDGIPKAAELKRCRAQSLPKFKNMVS